MSVALTLPRLVELRALVPGAPNVGGISPATPWRTTDEGLGLDKMPLGVLHYAAEGTGCCEVARNASPVLPVLAFRWPRRPADVGGGRRDRECQRSAQ